MTLMNYVLLDKRLSNEFKKSTSMIYESFDENRILKFFYNNQFISLKIPRQYPFYPPTELHVNLIPINYNSLGDKEMLKKYFHISCLCCETILCYFKWKPLKNLEKICEEYIYFKDLANASIVFNHIELTNKLPGDMIKIIGNFLN